MRPFLRQSILIVLWLWHAVASAAPPGGDFTLPTSAGTRFSLADQRGKVVLLYFGFTRCPDVCPTGLILIGEALERMGARAADIVTVFVSLDPARETAEGLTEYTRFFHPAIVPLLGTEAAVQRVARQYGVRFRKIPVDGPLGYTLDHTAEAYLIDRHGRLVRILPHGTPGSAIAKALEQVSGR